MGCSGVRDFMRGGKTDGRPDEVGGGAILAAMPFRSGSVAYARFGVEGGPAAFDLNAAANQANGSGGRATGSRGSTAHSSDGQSSLSTGGDGCMYFSSGGISASTC